MHERPDGPGLLDAARRLMLNELLPLLPQAGRYAALMAVNAMAIAARDAERNTDAEAAIEIRARALLQIDAGSDCWSALARAIRTGRFDPGTADHAAAQTLLLDYTAARCRVSCPKRLGRRTG